MRRLRFLPRLFVAMAIACGALREASAADDHDFFEKRIRPILVMHCYECHSATSKKLGGNLRLDTRSGLRTGGDNGPALVAGEPKKSLLVQAVRYDDDSLQMPPAGKLPQTAIDDLERWIKEGAADPRTEDVAVVAAKGPDWSETLAARKSWWSLQPVKKPAVPPRDPGTSEHPIDRFIAAELRKKSLIAATPADDGTLLRRLSLVLTGLPPKFDSTPKTNAKNSRAAYEAALDRLLASPHFGERWARHWMDVVRFSETHGNEWNYEVHHAWRYRDYLIRAFNADVPYDRFVLEHIAGDLLPDPRVNLSEQINESVIGTAFYRFGEVNHDDCIGLRQIGYDLADNQLDTLTKAFQATTVACARCHDHKIDAVSTRDYHALLGILRSSRSVSHTIDLPAINARPIEQLLAAKKQLRWFVVKAWQRDTSRLGRYLRGAAALSCNLPYSPQLVADLKQDRLARYRTVSAIEKATLEKSTPDDPFDLWRSLLSGETDDGPLPAERWQTLVAARRKLATEREVAEKSFKVWADFRTSQPHHNWQEQGQGLSRMPVKCGELDVAPGSDDKPGAPLVRSILPAGRFTHSVSDKLNGTLRSPPLPAYGKYISLEVVGRRSSAVRLVSNNCQLNYKNYRALTFDEPTWVTFPMPDDRASLGTYVELMTMLDNPKFPDQLSSLGGDKDNYRLPWDEAAGDKRSYFGITRVLIHDDPKPPEPTLEHLTPLLDAPTPQSLDEAADLYARTIHGAILRWSNDQATDADVRWLSALLKNGLLSNSTDEILGLDPKFIADYREIEATIVSPRIAPGFGDFGDGFDQPIFVRGDWQRPGPTAPRGYLEVFDADEFKGVIGSGRLEVARRIASADNPLTARVMVNRVWHHMLGAGLVRTVDDFGRIGELPSHPELLDYLAAKFVEEGWSVKRLIRFIATSETFRATAAPSAAALEVDPENRLLSHYPARRLEAEGIRDALLAASGRLDETLFGPSVQPYREKPNNDRRLFPGPLDGAGRRSIYIKFNLMESAKFLSAFNIPGGKVAQGRRDVSQVPAQALALLNDPLVADQAKVWAERLVKQTGDTLESRIDGMFRTAYGRTPSTGERADFAALVAELAKQHAVARDGVLASVPVWRDAAHALFTTEEFIFIP
jgi:hypothetical protein